MHQKWRQHSLLPICSALMNMWIGLQRSQESPLVPGELRGTRDHSMAAPFLIWGHTHTLTQTCTQTNTHTHTHTHPHLWNDSDEWCSRRDQRCSVTRSWKASCLSLTHKTSPTPLSPLPHPMENATNDEACPTPTMWAKSNLDEITHVAI